MKFSYEIRFMEDGVEVSDIQGTIEADEVSQAVEGVRETARDYLEKNEVAEYRLMAEGQEEASGFCEAEDE